MSYHSYFEKAQQASRAISRLSGEQTTKLLNQLADELVSNTELVIAENKKDLAKMPLDDPKYDRLLLNEDRIAAIAADVRNVAQLQSPIGENLMETDLPNGLHIEKIRVPLGVVGVVYEARPNVTVDVFSLCFKTRNIAILKGGSDAHHSNLALTGIIKNVLKSASLPEDLITLLPAEREATEALLNATEFVDVIIPRGSQSLINYVREASKVPVIETGAGIVHTYVDEDVDIEKAQAIIFNAKTRRVSVCNALDCLLIHKNNLNSLSQLILPLAEKNVVIYADEESFKALDQYYPSPLLEHATQAHFGTEFLDYKLAIKCVESLDEALDHIAEHSSKHSEAIISTNETNIEIFLNSVDAAAVYANTSTAFTDGAQFGLGAEIGISTQKLHARGPMGLAELTTYKWVLRSNSAVRKG